MYITGNSKRAYAGHQDQFINFCGAFDIDPLTVSELELCLAVTYYATGHTVNSVPPYLSALQNLYDNNGAGPLPRGPRFHCFHRGLKRMLGSADVVVHTRAITMEDLARICTSLDPTDPIDACFGAQITTAFFLALRTEDHTDGRLRWGDVYPQDDGSLEFLLPPGKVVRTFRHVAIAPRQPSALAACFGSGCAHGGQAAAPADLRRLHHGPQRRGLVSPAFERQVHCPLQARGFNRVGRLSHSLRWLLAAPWGSHSDVGGGGPGAGSQASRGLVADV